MAETTVVESQPTQAPVEATRKEDETTFEPAKTILKDFDLSSIKLSEIAKHDCIKVYPTTSLSEALHAMKKNRVSCLLIYDKVEKKYIGAVDCFAIMAYISSETTLKELLTRGEIEKINYEKVPVSELMQLTMETEFLWAFEPDNTLDAIMEPLCKGVHRVTVNKIKGHPEKRRIISQRDVLEYLYKWSEQQKATGKSVPFLDSNIRDLGLDDKSPVECVDAETPAIEAFHRMYKNKVLAVAIKNESGALVGNLSVNDLLNLNKNEKLPYIFLPSQLFLREIHRKDPAALSARAPVTVSAKDTLFEVMGKLVRTHLRRVWVIENNTPVGVITLSDIIAKFSKQNATLIAKR